MTEYEQQRISLANQITGAVNQLWLSGMQSGDTRYYEAAQAEIRARKLQPSEVLTAMGLSAMAAESAGNWLEGSGYCFLVFESDHPEMSQFFPSGQMTRVKADDYRTLVTEIFSIRRSVIAYLQEQSRAMAAAQSGQTGR